MSRTTSELVEAIIEVDSDITLTPFISAANGLITQCCTNLGDNYEEYTDDRLQEIETWLAAHFYAIRDPRAKSEKAGSVSVKFQSKVDLGLSTTHYGQMAKLLDYQGGLASLDLKIKQGRKRGPSITWIGKTEEESNEDLN